MNIKVLKLIRSCCHTLRDPRIASSCLTVRVIALGIADGEEDFGPREDISTCLRPRRGHDQTAMHELFKNGDCTLCQRPVSTQFAKDQMGHSIIDSTKLITGRSAAGQTKTIFQILA